MSDIANEPLPTPREEPGQRPGPNSRVEWRIASKAGKPGKIYASQACSGEVELLSETSFSPKNVG